MIFLVLIYIILALWAYLAYKDNLNQDKEPPLLNYALPIIGHLHYLLGGDKAHFLIILEVIFSEGLKHGDGIRRIMIGRTPYYLITDPEDCFTVANSCLSKPSMPYGFLNTYLGHGLFTELRAQQWKSCRKVLNPAFNQHMLDQFLYIFNEETRSLVKKLKNHVGAGPFNHSVYMRNFTLDNVIRTVLNTTEEDIDTKNIIVKESHQLLELASMRITNVWLYSDFVYHLTAFGKKERESYDRLNRITEEFVNKKKMQLKLDLDTTKPTENKFKPVLNILLELEDSGVFTRKNLMDQTNTMILGAYHTSAIELTFILCAIGTYPNIQERIYAELLEVCGTSDRDVTKKDLANLVYLEAVIKETLRLYPVGPLMARYGDTAVKIKEYTIPKNSNYIIHMNGTNRSRSWGPDRNVFKPERWLDPATLPKNPNAFMSFSIGRRACIGRIYAMNFLKVVCVHILRQYKIKSNINKIQLRLDMMYTFHSGHEISIENRQ